MNHSNYIGLFLSMLAVNVPTLIVCLVAGVVILTKWQQAASAALWALLGFGLILVLCFVIPIMQAAIQPWVFQSGNAAQRVWVFSVLTVFWSVLHALGYVFLLVAVFAGRPKPGAATPPPSSLP